MDRVINHDRLRALEATGLMDSAAEEAFDRFTRLARAALNVPVSLVSLVDDHRQFFKSADGLPEPWATRRQSPLSQSLCKRVVANGEPLIVTNLGSDPRLHGDRRAGELGVIAYLGFPIRSNGQVLGSFCVIDTKPHNWTDREIGIVRDLAAAVEAETALRSSVQRSTELVHEAARKDIQMTTLLEAIGEGVYGVDTDGRCTFMNRAAREMLGYELDQVLGQDMHELIHHTRPDGTKYPRSECVILQNSVRAGRVVRLENEVLWRADRTPFTAEYSSYPLRVDGTQIGSVLTFNDTTLRQDAHKRLSVHFAVSRAFAAAGSESEVVTRTLAAIGTGLGWDIGAFWELDPTEAALRCANTWSASSVGVERFLDATLEGGFQVGHGLPGRVWLKAAPEIIADIQHYPHFERHDEAKRAGLRAAFAFPAMAGAEMLGVMEFFTRRELNEEPSLIQSVMTLGELVGQYLRRQRAESEVLVTRQAIEASSTGVSISDASKPNLPLIYCNPAFERITGYTPEEVLGRNCRFLQGPGTSQRELDEVRAAIRDRRDCRVVLQNYRKDGVSFWNELTLSPVVRRDGTLTHFVGVQNDVTERRHAERALATAKVAAEEANLAKSHFIANMSHELRTPVAAVIGYAELLEEEIGDLGVAGTDTVMDDVRKICGSARHLLDLINGVLDLSKIEAGKMELQVEDFELGALMREVVDTVSGLVAKKANHLIVDFVPASLGSMQSDPVKLRQCLFNLLSNAAKFTENGEVTLSARREPSVNATEPDRLRFRVSDTGIGMTPEQMDRLFTRFAQADSSTTRRFGGTGLGLALTKSFCLLLGGDVSVASEQGQGTIFDFWLPAKLHSAQGDPLAAADPVPTSSGRTNVVLVIDDDPATRDLITRFLAREGLASQTAHNGEDGLRLARLLKPAAILLDVLMPRMDGWAVLTKLKSTPDLEAIPVIMVSVVQERGLAFSLGAADFVTKPIDWPRLRQTIERHRPNGIARTALLIEYDEGIRGELGDILKAEGWSVVVADPGESALLLFDETRPEVVLLDLHAPEPGGLIMLNELRQREYGRSVPVIAITERSVTAPERERLQGQVRRILMEDNGQMQELANELRRIGAARTEPDSAGATESTHDD